MKIDIILLLLAVSGVTNAAHMRGYHNDQRQKERRLKKSKGAKPGSEDGSGDVNRVPVGAWPTQPALGQDSGVINRIPGSTTTNIGSGKVGDGNCCDGPAQPQPASPTDGAGNRVGGCSLAPGEGYKPVFRVDKKSGFRLNEYITGVPREYECACNDQCADQDGTSMICCFRSHYFVAADQKNIQLCVDLSGVTEAAMNGCVITPEAAPALIGDPLDVALPIDPQTGVAVDPNK